jgi:hypothetical protein
MKRFVRSFVGALAGALVFAAAVSTARTVSADEIRVVVAPPAPRIEVPVPRPGPYHVWQPGVWVWHTEGRYVWHPGRWVLPPQGKTVWVRDEWVSYGGAWHMVPGHWQAVGEPIVPAQQRVVVIVEPPPEQIETVPTAPAGHTWIKGHWSWSGHEYVWVPGHLMAVPEGFVAWEPGHWFSLKGHWFFREGYWR